ncbi:MAG: hypothetical protein ABJC13_13750 [Acidobacteriota bacterium]
MIRPLLLRSLVLLGAALPAAAETLYLPNPDTNGKGSPTTRLLVQNRDNVSRPLKVKFIPTGASGTGTLSTKRYTIPAHATFALSIAEALRGVGMEEISGNDSLDVTVAAWDLKVGSQNLTWSLPLLDESNRFEKNETAYLKELAATAAGMFKPNIELINLASAPAVCTIARFDSAGVAILPNLVVNLSPLSHRVRKNVVAGLGLADGVPISARVTCTQPFWALGTVVGTDPLKTRLFFPLDAPSPPVEEAVTLDVPGAFFTPVEGASYLEVPLPLVPGTAYRRATIDYDLFVGDFSPIFTGLLGMFHAGGPRFNKTLYFGSFARAIRDRSIFDQGIPVIEAAIQRSSDWTPQSNYHVRVFYDTEGGRMRWIVTEKEGLLRTIMAFECGIFNLDLADRDAPIYLAFGLPGVADNAYYPPIGWRFTNLAVRVER